MGLDAEGWGVAVGLNGELEGEAGEGELEGLGVGLLVECGPNWFADAGVGVR